MVFFEYPYLTESAKESLKDYKYKSGDASILSYYMQPYWEYCAKLIPRNVAPNTVTLLGFLGVMIGWILLMFYSPNLQSQVPSYVYLLNALFLFYYQTMDAIDGKHARNTKNSSALGELFDHGLDALIGYFQCIILVSACDLGNSYYSLIVIILYYMTSMMMIWEDYVTDEMRFGKFNSPTEAIMFAIVILITTFIMNQSTWSSIVITINRNDESIIYYYLFKMFTTMDYNILNIQFNYLTITIATLLGASIVINNIRTVLKFASHSTRKRSHRTSHVIGGVGGALKGLISYMVTCLLFVLFILNVPYLVNNHFIAISMIYGLSASYIQTRLIFARVCGALAPSWFIIMIPSLILTCMSFVIDGSSLLMIVSLHVGLLMVISCYIHMGYHVIKQVCNTLNIHAFKVKPYKEE